MALFGIYMLRLLFCHFLDCDAHTQPRKYDKNMPKLKFPKKKKAQVEEYIGEENFLVGYISFI